MAMDVNPSSVWAPFGPFSMAMIQGQGHIVHLKGQVALDRTGEVVGPHDMRVQVKQVYENIRAVLESLGGSMGDIVSVTHHATDIDAFMAAGDIRRQYLSEPFPVSTTVEVTRLYRPELVIETTVIAEIPKRRLRLSDRAQGGRGGAKGRRSERTNGTGATKRRVNGV